MNIEDCRAEIDAVDEKIIHLLNRRAELVAKIGEIKQLQGLPIYDPARENTVLSNIYNANKGPLDNETLEKFFKQIIAKSKLIESSYIETTLAS
ncbi:MAG: chorismate mutase [Blastocatellia bacterium]|nr:chorismate mutase [Blastocatellia bacterium]MBL8194553.1 chorismate mutase [Blastocatellia bacterium]MBN8722325.1 chorismate mutase [Acidobacteriota bacterium]